MKRPYPDVGIVVTSSYIDKLAFVRKFLRYWGTTTVDGVEVLTPKKYYYKNMDESTVKLTKFLKVYKDLKDAKMEGVDSAWLYLNYRKEGIPDYDNVILADNLNTCLGTGRTVTLVLGAKVDAVSRTTFDKRNLIPVPVDTSIADQPGVIAEVLAEYQSYWDGGYLTGSDKKSDPYYELLTRYVLFSGEVPYTITSVKTTVAGISVPIRRRDYDTGDLVITYEVYAATGYAVTIDIGEFVFQSTTDIVVAIMADAKASVANAVSGGSLNPNVMLSSLSVRRSYDEDGVEAAVYTSFPFDDVNEFWHGDSSYSAFGRDVRYLKASTLTGPTLSLDQKIDLISSIIDGDYDEESTEWWETLLIFIIIIIAVYFQQYQFAAAAAKYGTIVAIAMVISTTALVLSLAAMAATALGMHNFALSIGKFLKSMAPLITIAGIISVYAIIKNFAMKGAESLAEKQVVQEGVKEGTKEAAVKTATTEILENQFVNSIMESMKVSFGDLLNMGASDISFDMVIRTTQMLFDAYAEQDAKDMQKKIASERSKLAEYAEADESSKTRHLLMDMAKVQYSPLNRDWSYYDNIYDRPYEWWATPYHIGCIQATTVNALWLTDKKDGIIK
jgi:hypothetical protein